MNILRMSAQNLFSTIQVELDLEDRGLLLIDGMSEDEGCSNGAGKSTVANKIILWTLFGRTAGGLKADNVANRRRPRWTAWGEVSFEGNGGTRYRVRRGRNPTALQLWEREASCPFTRQEDREEVELSARQGKDTQELIDQALGRDFNTFLHTDFFGQGRKDSFLELSPKQQGDLLEEILPIDKVSEWLTKAKELKDKKTKALGRIEALISTSKTAIWEKDSYISDLLHQDGAWIQQTAHKVGHLEHAISVADDVGPLVVKRDKLYKGLLDCDRPSADEIKKELVSWNEAKERWTREVGRVDTAPVEDSCNKCNQLLPDKERARLIKEHEDNIQRLESYQLNLNASKQWVTHWEASRELLDRFNQFDRINEQVNNSPIGRLRSELKIVKAEHSPYRALIDATNEDMERYRARQLAEERSQDELQLKLERIDYWVRAFSKDFKALLLQKACPYLEVRTREHLSGLGNPQLKVAFSTTKLLQSGDTRDEFNVKVSSMTGGEGFDTLSGGEQQIVSFAVGLALADLAAAQVGGPSKFMILDEPFMSLSEKNCENVVAYLQGVISKTKATILLISNEQSLKMLIPDTVQVVKQGGITSIEK